MPEGDTLHRTAERLRPALAGGRVTRFSAPRLRGDRPRPDVRVEDVEARGKNLLVHFDDGLTLRTHLRMTGSWHIYRTGERWQQSPGKARAVIEVDTGWVAVCFAAPVVETYRRGGPEPAPLARLGPDLCRDDGDLDAVLDRWTALAAPDDEVGVLLLDQRLASGIGNVYRSEVLFFCGLDPFTPAAEIDAATRRRLYATASRLLRANLTTTRRRTLGDGLAVYGRPGRPCPKCGTLVRTRRQGEQARSVYWCPKCQTRP
ncbi:MAG TPA: DNA-formamidopyrimidine glycosylase family protein [Acidimicrobiales bacterium]|nr:DNA-formamidopyrimidine glycosylase family protein [Acidimicrobiales bacterium]